MTKVLKNERISEMFAEASLDELDELMKLNCLESSEQILLEKAVETRRRDLMLYGIGGTA